MPNIIEGSLNGKGLRIGIIVSRFNDFITNRLYEGALDCLKRHEVLMEDIDTAYVPGAFEMPTLSSKMAKSGKYDAIICLGAIIRGATTHYDLVAAECAKGIAKVSLETELPILFGVLTTENIEQAIERAGTKAGNKGWECGLSAIEMANLFRNFK